MNELIRAECALITDIYPFPIPNLNLSKSPLILRDLLKGTLISLDNTAHPYFGKPYFEIMIASETFFQVGA